MASAVRSQRNPVDNQTILAIAADQFAQQGFAGARMEDIAQHAGVNKATLYYRIGDKEALYEKVIISTMDRALTDLRQVQHCTTDPCQQLRQYIQILANHIQTHPTFTSLVLHELASSSENISLPMLERLLEVRALFTDILRHGEAQQLFRSINPVIIYMQTIGALIFYASSQMLHQRIPPLKMKTSGIEPALPEAAIELTETILRAIKL
ncbi:MAG: TetR/AcrR family transcriptional regulator [Gammaproteobacteria bacterium]|nr:TetR/AcrR family transcriptional regulator [Gammaproteobacteria bacterium]